MRTIAHLTALDGGASLSEAHADAQCAAGWGLISAAIDQALGGLHPLHPQRHEFLAMRHAVRNAAGQPDTPTLRECSTRKESRA